MLIKSENFAATVRVYNTGVLPNLMRHGCWLCWRHGWKLNECINIGMKLNCLPISFGVNFQTDYFGKVRLLKANFLSKTKS